MLECSSICAPIDTRESPLLPKKPIILPASDGKEKYCPSSLPIGPHILLLVRNVSEFIVAVKKPATDVINSSG